MINPLRISRNNKGGFDHFLIILITAFKILISEASVIPPPWAEHDLNPCAAQSWQLLYWPPNKTCYKIFSQGPCNRTQEFHFDRGSRSASCRCRRGELWHRKTDRCYEQFSTGPCDYGEFIARNESGSQGREGLCQKTQQCPDDEDGQGVFWPATGRCYPKMTKGPCGDGRLLYKDKITGSTICGCNRKMKKNYRKGDCYELYSQGSCKNGQLFIYNEVKQKPECYCGPDLNKNYDWDSNRCYELNSHHHCPFGQAFTFSTDENKSRCSCLPDYVQFNDTGYCYRAYTQGPCSKNEYFKPIGIVGECTKKTCRKNQLFHPETNKCYDIGRRGPCLKGKVWLYDEFHTFKGKCSCSKDHIHYWPSHDLCYELHSREPCPKKQMLQYNKQFTKLECACDHRRGYVKWTNNTCIKRNKRTMRPLPVAAQGIKDDKTYKPRLHRGLTLPDFSEPINGSRANKTHSIHLSLKEKEHILGDILLTIIKENKRRKNSLN